jgi:hypothetical protein
MQAELYDEYLPMDDEALEQWRGRRAKFVLNFDVEALIAGEGLEAFYTEVEGVIGALLVDPEITVMMPEIMSQPGNIVTLAITGEVA